MSTSRGIASPSGHPYWARNRLRSESSFSAEHRSNGSMKRWKRLSATYEFDMRGRSTRYRRLITMSWMCSDYVRITTNQPARTFGTACPASSQCGLPAWATSGVQTEHPPCPDYCHLSRGPCVMPSRQVHEGVRPPLLYLPASSDRQGLAEQL